MSSVSDRMGQRCLASAGSDAPLALADLRAGQRCRVVGYSDDVEPNAARRLFDLGLVPGIEVTVVRRAPLRDPVIYRVGDYEIALRRQQSRCIRVEAVR